METIIIESADEVTTEKIKVFLKDLQVSYKTKKKKDKPYDPEFVNMVLERAKSGNTVTINPDDLWASLGLK